VARPKGIGSGAMSGPKGVEGGMGLCPCPDPKRVGGLDPWSDPKGLGVGGWVHLCPDPRGVGGLCSCPDPR
jgi:hypothetical protein